MFVQVQSSHAANCPTEAMSGVARESGQVGRCLGNVLTADCGTVHNNNNPIIIETDHIISYSMERVVSLDDSIITIEHRVKSANFLFSPSFSVDPSMTAHPDSSPRSKLPSWIVMACHIGVYTSEGP